MPGNDARPRLEILEPDQPGLTPRPATTFYLHVLGPVGVRRGGRPVPLGRPQARTVLAMLVLAHGQAVSADRLADTIWQTTPPASARVQLQGHISSLRRALGARNAADPDSPILTTPSGYRLHLVDGQLDLDVFRAGVTDAHRLRAQGRSAQAAERLRAALALWHGPPFADITAPAVRAAADHLAELRLAAVQDRIEADLASGAHNLLIPELRQLVRDHPFRERLWADLMTALVRAGRAAEALAAYREIWRLLGDELGIVPSARLQQLHQAILRGESLLTA